MDTETTDPKALDSVDGDLGFSPDKSSGNDDLGFVAGPVEPQSPAARLFHAAVVPGHPLDTMINGLKAYQAWAGQNKGMVADMALQGGAPAVGQRVAGPVGGFVGGVVGDILAQARQMYEAKNSNLKDGFRVGEAIGSGIVGAVPSKATKNAPINRVAAEATWQGLVNLAAEVVQTGMDKKRLPTYQELAQAFNAGAVSVAVLKMTDAGKLAQKESIRKGNASFKDETFINAHNNGYLLDPRLSNPDMLNKGVSLVAGESQLQATASKHNQGITNRLAKEELNIKDGVPIEPLELAARQFDAAKPYREVARISPAAAAAVSEWKDANFKAKKFWKSFVDSGNPDAYDRALSYEAAAEAAHNAIIAEVKANKAHPGLVFDLDNARVEIAKIHAVDSAMNRGSGDIDARVLGGMLDKGLPLTGNLETIARFQQAMPQVMGSPTQASTATRITRLGMYAGGIAGGALLNGKEGAAIGAAVGAVAPIMARKTALSQPYQALQFLPKYADNAPDTIANALRFATAASGR